MAFDICITVGGEVDSQRRFGAEELAALPEQIPDVGQLVPGRQGAAVRLGALLAAAGVRPGATHATLIAEGGSFFATAPIDALRDAVIVYRQGDAALPTGSGGPFRFLIPGAMSCRDTTAPVDRCANVKYLERIELSVGPGRDTRPTEEERDRRHGKRAGGR